MRWVSRNALGLYAARVGVLAAIVSTWEFVPKIEALQDLPIFNPFFISSPSRIVQELSRLLTGTEGSPLMWPFLGATVVAALVGTAAGTVLGGLIGLAFSNSSRVSAVFMPFILAVNAVPRVALIPVVLIIFGPSIMASAVTAVMVVFFIVFFNAFEGGRSVPIQVLQNAHILGAGPTAIMRDVRLPYVFAWTFAALPNAVSFGLLATVTAEILTGTHGMGRLLVAAVASASSSLTFAVVVILGVTGWLLVASASLFIARWLHWWRPGTLVM